MLQNFLAEFWRRVVQSLNVAGADLSDDIFLAQALLNPLGVDFYAQGIFRRIQILGAPVCRA